MEGLFTFLIIAVWFYLMMRWGCGAHMIHGNHGSAGHHDDQAIHTDPVCGMEVKPHQGYGKMHDGQFYRFCSRI